MTSRIRRFLVAATLGLLMLAALGGPLGAQESGLYGADAPEDAAYVRVAHANDGSDSVSVSVGATEFGRVRFGSVTDYRPVATGLFALRVAGHDVELVSQSGAYYTIVVGPVDVAIHEDREHTSPADAQLVVYNVLRSGSARLVAADRDVEVVPSVATGTSAAIAVTPVAVDLVVHVDGGARLELGDPGLERGESYSVFVFERDGTPDARVVTARVVTDSE